MAELVRDNLKTRKGWKNTLKLFKFVSYGWLIHFRKSDDWLYIFVTLSLPTHIINSEIWAISVENSEYSNKNSRHAEREDVFIHEK